MLQSELKLTDDFPPVGFDEWRELVEKDLKGAPFDKKLVSQTYEGIAIQPLYTADGPPAQADPAGFPGLPPNARSSHLLGLTRQGWDVCQEYDIADPAKLNAAIRKDVDNGVTAILVRVTSADNLDAAMRDIPIDPLHIGIDAGADFDAAASELTSLRDRRGVTTGRGSFNADPLAVLATTGHLPGSIDDYKSKLAALAKATADSPHDVTAVGVSTAPYHRAGASAAQDLAMSMATGVEYLRTMEADGLSITDAAGQIRFHYHIGCPLFMAIAKQRAARRLWARIIEAAGGGSVPMTTHVRTADRVLTQRDPWVNMLRDTICCFAAAVGGADAITLAPFDAAIGPPDDFSRRVARNTQLLLRDESHLNHVIDPAGGSWFIEKLTDELAQKAWSLFQEIESRGGASTVLVDGWIRRQIKSTWQARLKNISKRKDPITGVSEFPNLAEDRIEKEGEAVSAKVAPAAESGTTITLLTPHPLAEPYEQMRDASDEWLAKTGQRPRIFLANMGPIAHHTARATYSKNFFEAGGIEALTNNGFADADEAAKAFARSGAKLAIICSSDKLYETVVPEVAPKLKEAGARTIILAGRPGEHEEAYKAAGVDRFIFMGCDVLKTLQELLREEGVMS